MQVNNVAQYNHQSPNNNRANVKFGDCKKIVCEEAMIRAREAFENNKTWKPNLDRLYDYEVHFMSDKSQQQNGKVYKMIIKPCEQASKAETENVSDTNSITKNLPTTISIEANCLEDNYKTVKYVGIRDFQKRVYGQEQGLISKIGDIGEYIFRCINNATKNSEIVKETKTTRQ